MGVHIVLLYAHSSEDCVCSASSCGPYWKTWSSSSGSSLGCAIHFGEKCIAFGGNVYLLNRVLSTQ